MFYVWHGENDYALQQSLDELKAKLGDKATADLNTTVLDGRSLSFDELRTTCDTMPFLAEHRLVIVEGLLARFEPRAGIADSNKQRSDPLESNLRRYLPTLREECAAENGERAGGQGSCVHPARRR
jgi:DNA polymerase-3 subunit delta